MGLYMAFDLDSIKNYFDKGNKTVEWIAEEVIRKKNWVALLILLDVILFALFYPHQLPFQGILLHLSQLETFKNKSWYVLIFWSIIATIFLSAVIVAVRTKKSVTEKRELNLSAIKGLLPFGRDDEEIYSHLQRNQNLTECLQAMNDTQWRFGVLCGESGVGKTSFLQAGLWSALEKQKCRCIYVKFSDLDPFESIKQACIKHLALSIQINDTDDFLAIIRKAGQQHSSPIVLIFDQFEQFFVHYKRKKDRETFIQALSDWYSKEQSLSVKILIGIRGDFFYRLNELQKAMKYSLSPMQSFRLERFEPEQATEVFCYIAQKEGFDYHRSFITAMTQQDLADVEDGLVSPVNIQVLAWMVAAQTDKNNRAFNRTTFQKLGGVEGLLERFLTRALEARETEVRRQAAIKVLLALTDLERNTRAGTLTIDDLRQKLKADLSEGDLREAVIWLSRGDVRLVAPILAKEEEKFELAHERIIPALRRIAGKQLGNADRANQLLDRRVNEWTGNERNSRYLFTLSELRLINKQKPFLTWGKDKNLKEDLLAASRKRLKIQFALALVPLLLFTIGWFAWDTDTWQLQLIKGELKNYSSSLQDDDLKEIVKAFFISEDFKLVSQVLDRMKAGYSKTSTVQEIGELVIKMKDKEKAKILLEKLIKIISEKFTDDDDKVSIMRSLGKAATNVGEKEKAKILFEEALKIASEKFTNGNDKVHTFTSIAESFIELGDEKRAQALLEEALNITSNGIVDYFDKSMALYSVIKPIINLKNEEKAKSLIERTLKIIFESFVDGTRQSMVLRSIINSGVDDEGNEKAEFLIGRCLKIISEKHSNGTGERYFADSIRGLIDPIVKLRNKEKATLLLKEIFRIISKEPNDIEKTFSLISLIQSFIKLSEFTKDISLLEEAIKIAQENIEEDDFKFRALSFVIEAVVKSGDKEQAQFLIEEILKTSPSEMEQSISSSNLSPLIKAIIELGESTKDKVLINKAFILFEKARSDQDRAIIWEAILTSKLAIKDVKSLRSLILRFDTDAGRANALAHVLLVYLQPQLVEEDNNNKDENLQALWSDTTSRWPLSGLEY